MKLKFIALLSTIASILILSAPEVSLSQNARRVQSTSSSPQNYIGVGATNSGLAAYSKFAISENFSLRPMIFFDDLNDDFNGTVIIPITYDFAVGNSIAKPFVGLGGGSQTRDFDIGLEFTSGIDYQLSKAFTATGLFKVQLFEENEVSALFGLGFNF